MSLLATTIPEDPAHLSAWLERQLVGLDLARLVVQLSIIHGPAPANAPTFDLLFAAYLDGVLKDGLSVLPRDLLRQLLTRPALLFALQEVVLTRGGPHWDDVLGEDEALPPLVESGRRHVEALAGGAVAPSREADGTRRPWYVQPWLVSLATAAAVLIAVGLWGLGRSKAPAGWGWDRPGALAQNVTREQYLEHLADAAGEWFNKRPETAAELARRILQLRQGCSTLLLAEHGPLSGKDEEWLREGCRKWAAKFDSQLADLEGGKGAVEVRTEVDKTVEQLVKALRERAGRAA